MNKACMVLHQTLPLITARKLLTNDSLNAGQMFADYSAPCLIIRDWDPLGQLLLELVFFLLMYIEPCLWFIFGIYLFLAIKKLIKQKGI